MIFSAAAVALLVAMVIALVRGLVGPSIYDRILAINSFGTKTVLMIAVYGFLTHRPEFLDISLAYALINFISMVALLKYFEYGDMSRSGKKREQAQEALKP